MIKQEIKCNPANDRIQALAVRVVENECRDLRCVNELLSLIMPKLRYYIWGIMRTEFDTDDVLSRTLEKIFVKMLTYDPKYRFTTWTYRIAFSESMQWLKESRRKFVDIDMMYGVISDGMVDDTVERAEREKTRDKVVSDIQEEIQRMAIDDGNLLLMERDINCRNYGEISRIYDVCENTAKTRVHMSRKKVRAKIAEMHPEINDASVLFDF